MSKAEEKSQPEPPKKETVFIKISDKGKGSQGVIKKGSTTRPHVTPSQPLKKKGSLLVLVSSIAIIIILIGAIFSVAQDGSQKEIEQPFVEEPTDQAQTESSAAIAIDEPVLDTSTAASSAEVTEVSIEQLRENALHAKSISEQFFKLSDRYKSSQGNVELFATAFAQKSHANLAFENEQYSEATKLWENAGQLFALSALQNVQAHYNQELAKTGIDSPERYGTKAWQEISNLAKKAKEQEAANAYSDTIATYESMVARIPQLSQQSKSNAAKLALEAAQSGEIQTASYFYKKLFEFDSQNQEARSHLFKHYYKAGHPLTDASGLTFSYIPPGVYTMGSPEDEVARDRDEIQRQITISEGFFLGVNEVTQQQWQAVMGYPHSPENRTPAFEGENKPVYGVTWQSANDFCEKLSAQTGNTYRLPTEAEWEYACRAGTNTPYNTGRSRLNRNEANILDLTGIYSDALTDVRSNGQANAWNLYDMHGNLWEWCSDWSAPYSKDTLVDPVGPLDSDVGQLDLAMKVVRGGSYYDEPDKARSANRWEYAASVSVNYIGFRVVKEIKEFK